MEFKERVKKRSLTDSYKNSDPIEALNAFKIARKATLVYNGDDSRIPVYTPGPRPSELLKKFVYKKEPEKLTRIDQIKLSLAGIQRVQTFKVRSDRGRINSMKILKPEIIKE